MVTGVGEGRAAVARRVGHWYIDPTRHDVFLAAVGPKEWQRVEVHTVGTDVQDAAADVTVDQPERARSPARSATSSPSDDRISFDVDQVGIAGAGEGVVLPQLEGRRAPRARAG